MTNVSAPRTSRLSVLDSESTSGCVSDTISASSTGTSLVDSTTIASSFSSGTGDFRGPLDEIFNDSFCLFGSWSLSPLAGGGELWVFGAEYWEKEDGEGRMTLSGIWAPDVEGGGEVRRFRLLADVVDILAVERKHRERKHGLRQT